jgi:hypothetical protein
MCFDAEADPCMLAIKAKRSAMGRRHLNDQLR